MDLFKDVPVEDFNKRFFNELNSVKEFIQYNDPDDFFDPEQEYGAHIMRCQENELDFIRSTMKTNMTAQGVSLTPEEFTKIFQSKREEIIRSRPGAIEHYIQSIHVTYIDPPSNKCDHKYLLVRLFCRFWNFVTSLML